MHTLKVTFYKQGDMIYFSQLDIFRLFMRALRRADFPIVYTAGFNPHPKISFSHAIKLGLEGSFDAKFYFEKELGPEEFKEKFISQIPKDLKVAQVEVLTN
jgi:radical SAM-linked protein